MSSSIADLRYAARSLQRSRGFFLLAVTTLAVGIGSTTALFTVVDAVLLRPLPFKEPDRLVQIMLGECPGEKPASELGDHSYLAYLIVEGVDQFHAEVAERGAEVLSQPATEPWGLREFSIRTPDGHRIRFGEPTGVAG